MLSCASLRGERSRSPSLVLPVCLSVEYNVTSCTVRVGVNSSRPRWSGAGASPHLHHLRDLDSGECRKPVFSASDHRRGRADGRAALRCCWLALSEVKGQR